MIKTVLTITRNMRNSTFWRKTDTVGTFIRQKKRMISIDLSAI